MKRSIIISCASHSSLSSSDILHPFPVAVFFKTYYTKLKFPNGVAVEELKVRKSTNKYLILVMSLLLSAQLHFSHPGMISNGVVVGS